MLSFGASSNHFAANVLVNYASGVQGSGQTAVRRYPSPDDIDIKLDIVSKYAVRKSQLWQGQRVVFLLSLCDKFDNQIYDAIGNIINDKEGLNEVSSTNGVSWV